MAKLNEIVAVANTKKTEATNKLTESYKLVQKRDLYDGLSKSYRPKDEEGEKLPPEHKNPQYTAARALADLRNYCRDAIDVVATLDASNYNAKGDIVVDGVTILSQVPVTHLLFLETQFEHFRAYINHIPTLDPVHNWKWDDVAQVFKTDKTEGARTKKQPVKFVKAEATEKHPAQVDVYQEDVVVGYWDTIRMSGAITEKHKTELLDRANKLLDAVRIARQQANSTDAVLTKHADKIFDFLLGRTKT
jgi:hypothetical protein